jgi:hypothetical protein
MISRALFFENSEELGRKGILGQAPSVVSMMNYRNIAQQFFAPVDFQLKMHSWAMWLKLKINRRGKGQARYDNSALTRH